MSKTQTAGNFTRYFEIKSKFQHSLPGQPSGIWNFKKFFTPRIPKPNWRPFKYPIKVHLGDQKPPPQGN